ncbi:tryptophan--tRNA ligase [Coraliomargarita akajimensis]|uniref:Tryptophan--tRNA ligase n=1 Tax=Coraliomargarita akajimensis (strain DSM 45221 / IAM 15411 / JCM 23193 / KCTC 12865 / 04OKA010-24) TaxID=583355 RepID=D5EKP0_CORAD|nr:tryptophan--tRNA ligase [Coraliomargarita akajimensis]ADE54947.1 tryptophanyl-tRNA synthetase [Coraliomargarita akajimensis DSM 45221]
MSEEKPVILTCAQPTGVLTMGNYLGAIKNWATMLDDHNCYFGVVDLHAITVKYTPAELRKNTLSCVAQYIACGLDPERANIFIQSHVIGHTELAWLLSCITPIGDLQRMTQFKEKAAKLGFKSSDEGNELKFSHEGARQGASVNSGLLMYPVLMAADILLYNADAVPVGNDQRQHLELCRDLAQRFNHNYSETFKIPEPFIPKAGARIMSLQDPTRKMSKSDENQNSTLYILDKPDVLKKKIMSAVTDSGSEIKAAEDKPGVSNLLQIHSAISGTSVESLEASFVGKGYGDLKKEVADVVISALEPVQSRYDELIGDKKYLESVLKAGAGEAQKRAYKVLAKVYRKAGFVERPR